MQLVTRHFQDDDLPDHDRLFVATEGPALSCRIKAAATELGLLTHVAHSPSHCDFFLPPVAQQCDAAQKENPQQAAFPPARCLWTWV